MVLILFLRSKGDNKNILTDDIFLTTGEVIHCCEPTAIAWRMFPQDPRMLEEEGLSLSLPTLAQRTSRISKDA